MFTLASEWLNKSQLFIESVVSTFEPVMSTFFKHSHTLEIILFFCFTEIYIFQGLFAHISHYYFSCYLLILHSLNRCGNLDLQDMLCFISCFSIDMQKTRQAYLNCLLSGPHSFPDISKRRHFGHFICSCPQM